MLYQLDTSFYCIIYMADVVRHATNIIIVKSTT